MCQWFWIHRTTALHGTCCVARNHRSALRVRRRSATTLQLSRHAIKRMVVAFLPVSLGWDISGISHTNVIYLWISLFDIVWFWIYISIYINEKSQRERCMSAYLGRKLQQTYLQQTAITVIMPSTALYWHVRLYLWLVGYFIPNDFCKSLVGFIAPYVFLKLFPISLFLSVACITICLYYCWLVLRLLQPYIVAWCYV